MIDRFTPYRIPNLGFGQFWTVLDSPKPSFGQFWTILDSPKLIELLDSFGLSKTVQFKKPIGQVQNPPLVYSTLSYDDLHNFSKTKCLHNIDRPLYIRIYLFYLLKKVDFYGI